MRAWARFSLGGSTAACLNNASSYIQPTGLASEDPPTPSRPSCGCVDCFSCHHCSRRRFLCGDQASRTYPPTNQRDTRLRVQEHARSDGQLGLAFHNPLRPFREVLATRQELRLVRRRTSAFSAPYLCHSRPGLPTSPVEPSILAPSTSTSIPAPHERGATRLSFCKSRHCCHGME